MRVGAAVQLQAWYRGLRRRGWTRAVVKVRKYRMAIRQQQFWRCCVARRRLAVLRAAEQRHKLRMLHSCLRVQRVFRGHKGRERWEVHERLRELDAKVAPLKLRLKQQQEDREKVIEEHEAQR